MDRHTRKRLRSPFRTLYFHQLEERRVLNGAGFSEMDFEAPIFHSAPLKYATEGEFISAEMGSMRTSHERSVYASKMPVPREVIVEVEYVIHGRKFDIFEFVGEGEPRGFRFAEPESHQEIPQKIPDQTPDQLTKPDLQTTSSSPITDSQPRPVSTVIPASTPSKSIATETLTANSVRTTTNAPLGPSSSSVAIIGAPTINPFNNPLRSGLNDNSSSQGFNYGYQGSNTLNSPTNSLGDSVSYSITSLSLASSHRSQFSESTRWTNGLFSKSDGGFLAVSADVSSASAKSGNGATTYHADVTPDPWSELAFAGIQAWSNDALGVTNTKGDSADTATEPASRTVWSLWVAAGACLGVAVLESWMQTRKKHDDRLSTQGMWLVGIQPKLPPIR